MLLSVATMLLLNNMLASAEDVKPVLVNGAPQYNMLASAEDV